MKYALTCLFIICKNEPIYIQLHGKNCTVIAHSIVFFLKFSRHVNGSIKESCQFLKVLGFNSPAFHWIHGSYLCTHKWKWCRWMNEWMNRNVWRHSAEYKCEWILQWFMNLQQNAKKKTVIICQREINTFKCVPFQCVCGVCVDVESNSYFSKCNNERNRNNSKTSVRCVLGSIPLVSISLNMYVWRVLMGLFTLLFFLSFFFVRLNEAHLLRTICVFVFRYFNRVIHEFVVIFHIYFFDSSIILIIWYL